MKTLVILLALSVPALACPKGSIEYNGNCAADLAPEKAVQTLVPSDEKPPRSGKAPYEALGIHVDMPSSVKSTETKSEDQSGKIPNGGVPLRS